MLGNRSAALATMLIGLGGAPAMAATCDLTVLGAPVVDDATCTVTTERGATLVAVEGGSAIRIQRSIMRVRLAGDASPARRPVATSFGRVVRSDDSDHKTCYFNQRAVLCIEQ